MGLGTIHFINFALERTGPETWVCSFVGCGTLAGLGREERYSETCEQSMLLANSGRSCLVHVLGVLVQRRRKPVAVSAVLARDACASHPPYRLFVGRTTSKRTPLSAQRSYPDQGTVRARARPHQALHSDLSRLRRDSPPARTVHLGGGADAHGLVHFAFHLLLGKAVETLLRWSRGKRISGLAQDLEAWAGGALRRRCSTIARCIFRSFRYMLYITRSLSSEDSSCTWTGPRAFSVKPRPLSGGLEPSATSSIASWCPSLW